MLRYRVHNVIRTNGPLSRAEIARCLAVSKPTVSPAVRQLIDEGLVYESGPEPSQGGRRGMGLDLVPLHRSVLGIDVGATNTRAAIADVRGNILASRRVLTDGRSTDALIAQLTAVSDELVLAARAPSPVSVAIGTPGVIDPESGAVRYAPNLPVLEHPGLSERLACAFGCAVSVHNDVNLAAVGEHWRGAARGVDTFVLVGVGTGLGLGIVVNGELFTGARGRAGEASLTRVHPMRARRIEDVVSGVGISARHRRAGGSGKPEDAFTEAQNAEAPGASVVREFIRYLAWTIAFLTTALDPQRVVIGGGIGLRLRPHLPAIAALVDEYGPFSTELVVSSSADEAGMHGAIWCAMWSAEQRLLQQLEGPGATELTAIAYGAFRESMADVALRGTQGGEAA